MNSVKIMQEDLDFLEEIEVNYPNIEMNQHDRLLEIMRDIIEQGNPKNPTKEQFRR